MQVFICFLDYLYLMDAGLGLIILSLIAVTIGAWVILSIPVYISARILTRGSVRFTTSMLATLTAPLIYIVVVIGSLLIMEHVGVLSIILALFVAPLAWLWVYKYIFKTGWLRALGITVLSAILFVVFAWVISFIISIASPNTPIFNPIPSPFYNV